MIIGDDGTNSVVGSMAYMPVMDALQNNAQMDLSQMGNLLTVDNMSPSTNLFFDGNSVVTHSREQAHGGKLEPDHVSVELQDFNNGEIKAWVRENGDVILASKDNRVPDYAAAAFVRFCKDNISKLQQHLEDNRELLADSTQVSFKKLGEQYDGKTIPKSKQESNRKQKRGRITQQPDGEKT